MYIQISWNGVQKVDRPLLLVLVVLVVVVVVCVCHRYVCLHCVFACTHVHLQSSLPRYCISST